MRPLEMPQGRDVVSEEVAYLGDSGSEEPAQGRKDGASRGGSDELRVVQS